MRSEIEDSKKKSRRPPSLWRSLYAAALVMLLAGIANVAGLTAEEAARAYPVHLRGVVTYYDPDTDPRVGAFFLCDPTGCICVLVPPRPILPLRAGTLIDMNGVSE